MTLVSVVHLVCGAEAELERTTAVEDQVEKTNSSKKAWSMVIATGSLLVDLTLTFLLNLYEVEMRIILRKLMTMAIA